MKPVRFRREAEHDLREIISYYEDVAPDALRNITDDIWRAIDLVQRYPAIGMAVPEREFRRVVSRRYHFKIAYLDDDTFVTILGIFRFQDRES